MMYRIHCNAAVCSLQEGVQQMKSSEQWIFELQDGMQMKALGNFKSIHLCIVLAVSCGGIHSVSSA